jgi:hypothetical protein
LCRPESPFCLQRPDALTGAEFVQIDSVVKEPARGSHATTGGIGIRGAWRVPASVHSTRRHCALSRPDLLDGRSPAVRFRPTDCGRRGDRSYPLTDSRSRQIACTPSDNAPPRAWKKPPREACSLQLSHVTGQQGQLRQVERLRPAPPVSETS